MFFLLFFLYNLMCTWCFFKCKIKMSHPANTNIHSNEKVVGICKVTPRGHLALHCVTPNELKHARQCKPLCTLVCLLHLWKAEKGLICWLLPDDVSQDPQLDHTAHHPNPPVPHQHLAWGLILKEEVREGVGDLALHLLSADPQRGGSLYPDSTSPPGRLYLVPN